MHQKQSLKSKLQHLISILPRWNTPPAGKELTLKEWLFYIIGYTGCYATITIIPFVGLQQGLYIAAARNINVDHIAIIGVVGSLFTILTTPLISWILDNTNTRWGKFRPYLLFMPIPLTICFFAIGQVIRIENYTVMIISYAVLSNIFGIFTRLYTAAYSSIPQVLSPSVDERTQIMSIGLMFSSMGPTIVNILFPLLANTLYATEANGSDGVNQLPTYTWLVPIMATCFMALGIFLAIGVKERTVVAKSYKQKQPFFQGVKKTVENKYFWIYNVSQLLGIMKTVLTTLTTWYILYDIAPMLTEQGHFKLAGSIQSIVTTIIGGACVPGMLLAPLAIKKFGNRKVMLAVNFGSALSMLPMLFISNAWLHLVCIFCVTVFNGFQIVAQPACQAELNDYQQFRTGDRIEGFLNQFGAIFYTAATMGTAFIAPAVQKAFGYVDDTQILHQHDVLYGILRTMAGIALGSALLAAIPYFFWDMTDKKHNCIMQALKVRAMHTDGNLDDDTAAALETQIMDGDLNALQSYLEQNGTEATADTAEDNAATCDGYDFDPAQTDDMDKYDL